MFESDDLMDGMSIYERRNGRVRNVRKAEADFNPYEGWGWDGDYEETEAYLTAYRKA